MVHALFSLMLQLADVTNTPPVMPNAAPPSVQASGTIPGLREVAPGILEYNGVKLDKKNRRISFPGIVNQREGLIEYLLVGANGKTHESIFSTKVSPRNIHLAMLLIGLKPDTKANAKEVAPPQAIDPAYLQSEPKLTGPSVQITVAWTRDGKRKEVPVEDWVLNTQTNHAMAPGSWTYNGSMIQDGVFLADEELSIVAVVSDPTALVNNPRKGYDDDEIWQARDDVIPPLDTPVEISITLTDSSTPTKP